MKAFNAHPRLLLRLAGVATAGVAAGHWLGYRVAVPDAHEHGSVLEATGHGYWPLFVGVACVALLAGLGMLATGRWRGRDRMTGRGLFTTYASALAVLQIGGFSAMEVVERLFLAPHRSLVSAGVLWGVLAQFVLALIGALLLTLLARTVDALAARFGARVSLRAAPAPILPAGSFVARVVLLDGGGLGLRGPPGSPA